MAESKGNTAASVLPPAVGATIRQSAPERTGSTAASCSGLSRDQPRELTTWYSTAGFRPVPAPVVTSQVQVDLVDGSGRPVVVAKVGGLAFRVRQFGRVHRERVVAPGVEVGELVDPVQDVDEFAQ